MQARVYYVFNTNFNQVCRVYVVGFKSSVHAWVYYVSGHGKLARLLRFPMEFQ